MAVDDQFDAEVQRQVAALTPATRRLVVKILGIVALACILAEVVLAALDKNGSDALLTVAASCVGGLAGLVSPVRGDGG